jgi:hypothetical protein
MKIEAPWESTFGQGILFLREKGRDEGACAATGKHRPGTPAIPPQRRGRRSCRAAWVFAAVALLSGIPASAEVTGVRIAKDETIRLGEKTVRHVVGVVAGKAERNEPGVPTLDKVVGLKYESDFELWLPAAAGNGRFWFSVLNRGSDVGGLRDGILRRGGAYGWCAWQARNVAQPKPQLKLSGFDGPMPQAYGLVVVRDFVAFLRYASGAGAKPNPAAGKVQFALAYGISQSGRFMRTFLLYGLNTAPAGKVFDGLLPNGARAGYVDLFRPNSDPGSGGTFSVETVHAPYSWSELMARSASDAKVFALNAESEYYEMMAYMTRRGPVPDNVRVYDFPLGGHGGGGTVAWQECIQPLSVALEQWACHGTRPPDSRMFTLERRESPQARHLPSEPAELPALDELGIAKGGVRLPPVAVPVVRYVSVKGESPRAVPLDKTELTRRYGTPENYRKKVSETVARLIQDRFLPESARAKCKYVADAEKVSW